MNASILEWVQPHCLHQIEADFSVDDASRQRGGRHHNGAHDRENHRPKEVRRVGKQISRAVNRASFWDFAHTSCRPLSGTKGMP